MHIGTSFRLSLHADVRSRLRCLPCVSGNRLPVCMVLEKRGGIAAEERWWPVPGWFHGVYSFIRFSFSAL